MFIARTALKVRGMHVGREGGRSVGNGGSKSVGNVE